ncbi:MAG: ATP-dependent metallopeptidase FtsH/Yme1/Tma family protein, partial [Verrucomicrobiia bacterium]
MEENQPRSPKSGHPPDGRDPRFIFRIALFWLAILILVPALWKLQQFRTEHIEEIPYGQVEDLVKEKQIKKLSVVVGMGASEIVKGEYEVTDKNGTKKPVKFTSKVNKLGDSEKNFLRENKVSIEYTDAVRWWVYLLESPLVFLVAFVVILYFFVFRQIKMAGRGAMSFGKSRARMLSRIRNKVTFKDVAGLQEAKEEVDEIIQFLKDPK